MTQDFNHQEAENFRSDVMEHFPQLDVEKNVLDVENEQGEYQFSFFSIWSSNRKFTYNFHSEEGWNGFLSTCQYIAGAIADNQQSEEQEAEEKSETFMFDSPEMYSAQID